MMPYQSYQLWATERPKTPAEQHAADARRGEFAAAMSRSFSTVGRQMRTLAFPRLRPGRSTRPADTGVAVHFRAAG
jgi:hypothetical protein